MIRKTSMQHGEGWKVSRLLVQNEVFLSSGLSLHRVCTAWAADLCIESDYSRAEC